MNKFLQLCEEFDPTSQSNANDAVFQTQRFFEEEMIDDYYHITGNKVYLHLDDNRTIELRIVGITDRAGEVGEAVAEEDDQIQAGVGSYDVKREVDDLVNTASSGLKGAAGRLVGTAPQRAKSAQKKRATLAKKAVDVYEKDTKALETGLKNAAMGRRSVATNY